MLILPGISDATPEGFLYETLSYSNGPGYTFHRVEGHSDKDNRSTSTINTFLSLNDSSHHGIMKQNASKSTEGTGTDDHRKIPHFAGFWMVRSTCLLGSSIVRSPYLYVYIVIFGLYL